jgi:transposase
VYSGGHAWTAKHDAWLRQVGRDRLGLGPATTRMTFESDYDSVLQVQARRDRLDAQITVMAAESEFTPIVRRLGCLRGIGTLTAFAFALAVAVGDWHRQDHRLLRRLGPLRAFFGSLPGAGSDHQDWQQPPAPAAGRGGLAPSARHVVGATMRQRWELAGPSSRARGDQGNRRLHHRWNTMRARHKRSVIANVAIARELTGWCWSLAVLEE